MSPVLMSRGHALSSERGPVCDLVSVTAFYQIPAAVDPKGFIFFHFLKCVWHSCLANMDSLIPAFLKSIILLISDGFMGSLSRG